MKTVKYSVCVMGAALVGKQEFAKAATEMYEGKIVQVRPGANKYIFTVEMQNCKYELSMITLYDTGFTTEEKEELKSHIDGYLLMFDVTNKFSIERVKNYMKLILQLHDPLSPILAEMNKNSWQNIHKKKRENQKKLNNEQQQQQQQNGLTLTTTVPPTLSVTDQSGTLPPITSPSSPVDSPNGVAFNSHTRPSDVSNGTGSSTSGNSVSQPIISTSSAGTGSPLSTTTAISNTLPVIIIGNKCDVTDEEREVDTKEGLQLGDKLGCPLIETSAIFKKKGIENAFIELIKRIDASREEKRKSCARSTIGTAEDNPIDRRKSISSIFSFVSVSTSNNVADDYQQTKRMREMRKQQLASKQ